MCSPTIDVPAVRSSLSKMSPSNHPYNLIKCYAAIKEVEKIMSVSSWKYPHAAFRHTENIGEFEYLKEVPEDYKPRKNEIVYELYNKHYIIITKKPEMKEAV